MAAFEGSSAEQTAKILNDVYDPTTHLLKTIGVGGAGGVVSILDGADVALGATTDAAITTDVVGTLSGKLRGLVKIFADIWDQANHALKVNVVAQTGGGLTDTQLRATPVQVTDAAGATEATLALAKAVLDLIRAKTDNLDVAISTRTKPADQQHSIVDISALPAGAATQATLAAVLTQLDAALSTRATEATLALIKAKTDNLDVLLSSRAITGLTDAQLRAAAVPVSGPLTDAQLRALAVAISNPALDAFLSTRATEATLAAVLTALASVAVTGPLTDAQLALRMGGASVDAPAASTELERLRRIEVAVQAVGTNTAGVAKAIAKLPQALIPVASMTTAFRGRV